MKTKKIDRVTEVKVNKRDKDFPYLVVGDKVEGIKMRAKVYEDGSGEYEYRGKKLEGYKNNGKLDWWIEDLEKRMELDGVLLKFLRGVRDNLNEMNEW